MRNDTYQLLVNDSQGIYIPQIFIRQYLENIIKDTISQDDIYILQSGPGHDWYWEAWDTVLDSAVLVDEYGIRWTLFQNGDLWAIREGTEIPEGILP